MLVELRVSNLGVIEDQTVVLGPGLTALTGETGAGKTLLVDAISRLTGAPADTTLVAPGATEARIEGRFVDPPGGHESLAGRDEVVLTRVIPAGGRSRCYLDGRMVSSAQLAEIGRTLVDIHGQHAHQSLLSPAAQRRALDAAAGIDTAPVALARRRIRELGQALDALGGDPRERARRLDLLGYQLRELDGAGLEDPDEDDALQVEEELLADAAGLAEAAGAVHDGLAGDDGVVDRLGAVVAAAAGRRPLSGLHDRFLALQEELSDAAAEARRLAESVEEDPERLSAIGERRRTLTELRRKYGTTLAEVIEYREQLRAEIDELASHDRRAAEVAAAREAAEAELAGAMRRVWHERSQAAPKLAAAVERELQALAMPRARFAIEVGPDPEQESVTWMLAANPGQPLMPLAKVASGGELARAMLAARLVMGPAGGDGDGPDTLVFDEVDAGIGGEAATAVGRALGALGDRHQVLVVTHLAQVAAFAGAHLNVAKDVVGGRGGEKTVAAASALAGEERVVELARMLSGRPDSDSARQHASELLEGVGSRRPSPSGRSSSG
ncbi:MAG TPA: DNA repair protein RecN [Acidimicrobiales bacterium]|nr:DNA repair protein RecN [Acidimicrobiales bacterium]